MTLVVPKLEPPDDVLRNRHRDPYPHFAWLREHAPVVEEVRPGGLSVWRVSRYRDVQALLADTRLSTESGQSAAPGRAASLCAAGPIDARRHLLHTDPPHHTRFRRLTDQAFSRWRTAGLASLVQQRAAELIDLLPRRGVTDLIASFAFPLTFSTTCDILGVLPEKRTACLREAARATVAPSHLNGLCAPEDLYSRLTTLVRRRPAAGPAGDLLDALARSRDSDGRLTEAELISTAHLLLTVSGDTTMHLIGNAVLALLRHPGQLGRLRYGRVSMRTAIVEFLRYDSPVRTATSRIALDDLRVGGAVIPRGAVVALEIGSANRDGRQFDRADELDVTRGPNDHLSFGHGPHHCPGAALARLVAEIAIGSLVERLDMWPAAADAALRWRPSLSLRGLVELPVSFRKL